MILINNNWEHISNLHDISRIVRENYNKEISDEIDKLITDYEEDYEELEKEFMDEQEENIELRCKIRDLKIEIKELKGENNESKR